MNTNIIILLAIGVYQLVKGTTLLLWYTAVSLFWAVLTMAELFARRGRD